MAPATLQAIIALVIVAMVGSLVMTLVFVEIPDPNRELLINLKGILEGAFIAIIGYYFGSSKGSADKTQIISKGT